MKQEIIKFLIWFRNGSAFCISWLLILSLIYFGFSNVAAIPIEFFIKLVILSMGGVLLFCVMFTKLLLRKCPFTLRLSIFFAGISVLEWNGLYWMGIFNRIATASECVFTASMLLGLYFVCVAIYSRYRKKTSMKYTDALLMYQKKRSDENASQQ